MATKIFALQVLACVILWGCESSFDIDDIPDCLIFSDSNFSLDQLHELADETAKEIRDSLIIKAVVISNDRQGNTFNELYLQNSLAATGPGLQIEMELRDSYLRYPPGSQVHISLKGLWVRKKHGMLTLGKPLMVFGAMSIGRIPYHELDTHVWVGCENLKIEPARVHLEDITTEHLNTLVQLQNVEFIQEEIGMQLAQEQEESIRHLTNCDKRKVRLITSGYSDFYDHKIPDAHGDITGIVLGDSKGFYIRIRGLEDLRFDSERCLVPVEPVTTDLLFISEIADPDNAPEARFIEIYNASGLEIPLEGWELIRYTNANTEPGSSINLSGHSVGSESTFVTVADSLGFATIFDMSPNIVGGKNSAADSNGDDTIILMDPFGKVIDIFGRIGEDGSGTDHEFEDGRAVRKTGINMANPLFNPAEWLVYNDTGAAGTINEPQQAPENYTPGINN